MVEMVEDQGTVMVEVDTDTAAAVAADLDQASH
jgi:hypothetical protein